MQSFWRDLHIDIIEEIMMVKIRGFSRFIVWNNSYHFEEEPLSLQVQLWSWGVIHPDAFLKCIANLWKRTHQIMPILWDGGTNYEIKSPTGSKVEGDVEPVKKRSWTLEDEEHIGCKEESTSDDTPGTSREKSTSAGKKTTPDSSQ